MLLAVVVVGLETFFRKVFFVRGLGVAGRGGLASSAEDGRLTRRRRLREPAGEQQKVNYRIIFKNNEFTLSE